jgi:hypothetical protein
MITKTEDSNTTTYEYGSIEEGGDWIRITVDKANPGGGSIESNLKNGLTDDEDDEAYSNAVDGMEAVLLALACQGFDLSGEDGSEAIRTTLEALDNNFPGSL